MNTILTELLDDGTLDTVVRVNEKVYRFNCDSECFDSYDAFLDWCFEDAVNQYQDEI